jgi:hypothetical protein
MKVAVVLTGHLRCWKTVVSNFEEKILKRYNPDVFIHSWSDEGYCDLSETSLKMGYYESSPLIPVEEVKTAFNAKEISIEDFALYNDSYEEFTKQYTEHHVRPKNLYSMFSKMNKGLMMMEEYMIKTNQRYDLVLRLRPDLIYHDDLPEFNPNVFYTNRHPNHMGKGTGDMMHVGNIFHMSIFSKILYYMPELYKQVGYICPHEMTTAFISNLNLPWQEVNINKTLMHTPKGAYVHRKEWA